MAFRAGPRPGEPFPDFDLLTTDGGRVRNIDFVGRQPLLISMGSVTCPMTAASDTQLKRLHDEFGEHIAFVNLYVREAHPGAQYAQPETMEQKTAFARDLKRRDALPWLVAVDDLEGTLHQQLDPKPNALYVMNKEGLVAFRALWSNDRYEAIREPLTALTDGRSSFTQSQARMIPMMRGLPHIPSVLRSRRA